MQNPKRRQYMHAKSRYRVKNWREYETGLRRRGDLTIWLSEEALDAWRAPPSGKPGGQRRYADIAIEAAHTRPCSAWLPGCPVVEVVPCVASRSDTRA